MGRALSNNESGSQKENTSSSSGYLTTPPLVSLLIALAAMLALVFVLAPVHQSRDLDRQANHYAQQQATLVGLAIDELQNRLVHIGQSAAVTSVFNAPTTAQVKKLSTQLGLYFPGAENVLAAPLNSKGITGLRKFDIKLRNNIEASLLNKAGDGQQVAPEAYSRDGSLHFTVVTPVLDESTQEIIGALLLRMPIAYLQSSMSKLDPSIGQSELVQIFHSKVTPLLIVGTANSQDMTSQQAIINDSTWAVNYTPSESIKNGLKIPIALILLILGIPALLIAGWHFLSLRKLSSSINRDIATLDEYTKSLTEGNRRMPPTFQDRRFVEIAKTTSEIRTQAPSTKSKKTISKKEAEEKIQRDTGVTVEDSNDIAKQTADTLPSTVVPDAIFRAYDIRGIAERDLPDDVIYAIGMAIGSEAMARSQDTIVVAADGRLSSPRIKQALCAGLQASGQHIIDIGLAPTPLMYFATHHLNTDAGVMITGSHNAADYNGLKLVLEGRPLAGEHIQHIKQRIKDKNYTQGQGSISSESVNEAYIETVTADIAVALALKIVVDAGNGIGGIIGPRLLEELGCEVIPINCEVDGNFPKHAPDPTKVENLRELMAAVKEHGADFGVAFDGDADRVCVVNEHGEPVELDVLLMLFAQDVVSRNPGADVVYDVKCTRHLSNVISSYGGRPIMWKSGHSFIKEKMLETGALLGGEYTGHICFKERWYGFDDGIYSAARLIEIISTSGMSLQELVEEYPSSACTPEIIIPAGEIEKFKIVETLTDRAQFGSGKITMLDGIRVDYSDGWGLIRPSNTGPAITLRFEADDNEALERIQAVFREQIGLVSPALASAF